MLRFFRLNDPYRLLAVLLALIAVSLPLLINPMPILLPELKEILLGELLNSGKSMYVHLIDDTPWCASWCSGAIDFLFGRSLLARHLLALLVIFFQASFFAFMLIRNRAYNESNYLPAFVFAIFCVFSFDMLSFSRELLASTFLLLALNNIFKEIEFKVQRDDNVLNIGIFLGVVSLLVFSYSIFLIGALVILLVFARISIRKSLLLTFGFIFPHLVLICLYYFRGGLPELSRYLYVANFTVDSIHLISWKSIFSLGSSIIIFFFFSLIMLNREARFTRYQSQLLQVMLLWLVFGIIEISITRELTPHSFITFAPTFTYLISHYLLLIRRKWVAEMMMWIFLLFTIGIGTSAKLGKLKFIDYKNLFVKESKHKINNKRVLTLGEDWGIYTNNKPASYFLNWKFSKEIFERPDYFENIVLIQESFEKEMPEIIIDENGLMEKVFMRLPSVKAQYEKKGLVYQLKNP